VVTGDASAITRYSATLNGSITNMVDASASGVYFEFGPTASYGNITSSQTITAPGLFSAKIEGLKPDTTYHFRAVVGTDFSLGHGPT